MPTTDPQPPPPISSPYLRSLLAGGIAGTTVDLSLFPLDTLKTRLQSQHGFLASGGFRGIYAGVGSALVGSAPGAALFFITYDSTKRFLLPLSHSYTGNSGNTSSRDALVHMLAASMGEVAACLVRVPTEVVKQRAQASQYPSSLAVFRHILRSHSGLELVRALYRGWNITIFREVPFTVIQFPLWEVLKESARQRRRRTGVSLGSGSAGTDGYISATESALYGSVSGAVAAGITTPLDVLKTRVMLATEPTPLREMAVKILRESGPRAFFAGIGPRIGWISAGGAIFLGSYQWAINKLGGESM